MVKKEIISHLVDIHVSPNYKGSNAEKQREGIRKSLNKRPKKELHADLMAAWDQSEY